MKMKIGVPLAFATASVCLALMACAPKVGSERWCEAIDDKPKGEWTANDATAYAKHCVLGIDPDQ